MWAYMFYNAPGTWDPVENCIQALNASGFPGLSNEGALTNWLAQTETLRHQKFVVPSVMYELGIGATLPTEPRLNVSRRGNTLILNWDAYWMDYLLESAPNLGPPAGWGPVSGQLYFQNGRYEYWEDMTGPGRFFRLHKP